VGRERYISKKKRDERAKELKAKGFKVRRNSARNQRIYPYYIEDYGKDYAETSLIFKVFFPVIYIVTWTKEGELR